MNKILVTKKNWNNLHVIVNALLYIIKYDSKISPECEHDFTYKLTI